MNETSSLKDFNFGMISNMIDDDMTIEVRNDRGDKVYIAEISLVITSPHPVLLITVSPF